MAEFYLLVNDIASKVDTASNSVGTIAAGYDLNDMIAGGRNTRVRLAPKANGSGDQLYYWDSSATNTIDYFSIIRADWLLTNGGVSITDRKTGAGGASKSNITGTIYNPLSASDLIGYKYQDLVHFYNPSTHAAHGFGLTIDNLNTGASESTQFSKMYWGQSFNFGVEPERGTVWEHIGDLDTLFVPQKGHFAYATEARISLTFAHIPLSKVVEFRSLEQILNWPLIIYDPNQYIWDYKMEHVLVETWQETLLGPDDWAISVTFRRLKHYD